MGKGWVRDGKGRIRGQQRGRELNLAGNENVHTCSSCYVTGLAN